MNEKEKRCLINQFWEVMMERRFLCLYEITGMLLLSVGPNVQSIMKAAGLMFASAIWLCRRYKDHYFGSRPRGQRKRYRFLMRRSY